MTDSAAIETLRNAIRDVPDFPKPGIVFKDITTLFEDPKALRTLVEVFEARYRDKGIERIVGIESRGFLVGTPLAYALNVGLSLIRKHGKLPRETLYAEYELEYGKDRIEMHKDAVTPGMKVLLVDDLLATGGTAHAAKSIIEQAGAEVVECGFIIELGFLPGREKVGGEIFSVLRYD